MHNDEYAAKAAAQDELDIRLNRTDGHLRRLSEAL